MGRPGQATPSGLCCAVRKGDARGLSEGVAAQAGARELILRSPFFPHAKIVREYDSSSLPSELVSVSLSLSEKTAQITPTYVCFLHFTERLQAALLGPRFGGVNHARRDKFLMNEAMRDAGLAAARQVKTGDRSKVREFLATLESKPKPPPPAPSSGAAADTAGDAGDADVSSVESSDGVLSVVKPARGCASGSVFRCRGEGEAMEAFEKIVGTPKYGTPGEFNDEVGA